MGDTDEALRLRLVDITGVSWQDRAPFFAVSSQMMRRILTDAARSRCADKRGGEAFNLNLNDVGEVGISKDRDLVALDDALHTLAEIDPRKASCATESWPKSGFSARSPAVKFVPG